MIDLYLKSRLKFWQLFALSILFSFLIYDSRFELKFTLINFFLLLTSLIVFRLIDDAGSVTIDRDAHPERTYLNDENYSSFLAVVFITTILFLFLLSILRPSLVISMIFFIIGSIILYLIFNKSKTVMAVIPLLKYPFLLWAISSMDSGNVGFTISIASFFIMLFYDLNDDEKTRGFILNFLCITVISLLIFPPWDGSYFGLLSIIPVSFVIWKSKSSFLKFIPLLFYPICYLLISLLT